MLVTGNRSTPLFNQAIHGTQGLYDMLGYRKETLTAGGPFADMMADHRSMTPEEAAIFRAAAEATYDAFVSKAAASRGMSPEALQSAAQGRVWSGAAAQRMGLVDALGGLHRAVAVAKQAAGLSPDAAVRVRDTASGAGAWLRCLVSGGPTTLTLLAQPVAKALQALQLQGTAGPLLALMTDMGPS